MVDSESHEGDAQPKPSMPLEHEDIGEVRDRSVVGYDPAVADLRGSPVQASNKACPLDQLVVDVPLPAGGPIRVAEERVDCTPIDARPVIVELVPAMDALPHGSRIVVIMMMLRLLRRVPWRRPAALDVVPAWRGAGRAAGRLRP